MEHEVVVDGYYLQVEVTHCVNDPAQPGTWSSDWDAQGERELEYVINRAICYDDDGVKMDAPTHDGEIVRQYNQQIINALWFEIDSKMRRRRVA